MYLKRAIDYHLLEWKNSESRKPLLLRGARQIGKTRSIRALGDKFENYLEINFEKNSDIHSLFEKSISPQVLIKNLTAIFNQTIEPGKTLLFFDEIQSCIPAIRSLRYFAEKMPNLHVVAVGSLLEFALEEIPSFGVGRIRSIFMYPMSFDEFLIALGEEHLLQLKRDANPSSPLLNALHKKLLSLLTDFLILGGMPEVIVEFIKSKDYKACGIILDDLINSLYDDFAKYKKRVPSSRISEVFNSVVSQAGSKFIYSKATPHSNHKQIKEALNLLIMAGLVIPITHTSANGLPLGAEINPKKQKMLLFDSGIFLRLLELDNSQIILSKDFSMINKGNVAEQFVGLEILKTTVLHRKKQLFYWHREAKSSNAEVDYIISTKNKIIPIEVKAGTKGSMQSMFQFLKIKNQPTGIRISNENFSQYENIHVYPLYAVSNIFE